MASISQWTECPDTREIRLKETEWHLGDGVCLHGTQALQIWQRNLGDVCSSAVSRRAAGVTVQAVYLSQA
jgi:hypothetical protein